MSRTTINNGDTGAVVRAALNTMTGDLYQNQGKVINPRLIFAGDSKAVLGGNFDGDSWAAWALGMAMVEYRYDATSDNCGVNGAVCDATTTTAANNGSGTATVLGFAHNTNIAVIVARVTARVAQGDNVVMWFQVGTNSLGDDTAHLASLQKVIAACRAAGAKLFLVNDVPPTGSNSAAQAGNIGSMNARLEQWANSQTDVKIIKHYNATVDFTSATSIALGGTGGTYPTMTKDGVHEGIYGAYFEGKMMAPQIAALFRASTIRLGGKGDVYQGYFGGSYPTLGMAGNICKNPFHTGTAGIDSIVKTGTASVTGSVPDKMTLSGTISGDVNITFAQVASTYLNNLMGRTDLTCVRMTFTGTPTAHDNISLIVRQSGDTTLFPLIQTDLPYTSRVMAAANALAGVQEFAIETQGKRMLRNSNVAGGFGYSRLPTLTETLMLRGYSSPERVTAAAGGPPKYIDPPSLGLHLALFNGVAVSGSVDLIYSEMRLVNAIPASL